MAKERLFDLPETKGTFKISGKVTGVEKDNFYKESRTKNGSTFRRVSFGIVYDRENDRDKTMYVSVQGMPQENVYFSRQEKQGDKTVTVTEKVPWTERFTFNKEGFRLIGNNIGLTKKVDNKGKTVNDNKRLTDFDSAKLIEENLEDDCSVFVKGSLEYSSYIGNDGNRRNNVRLDPNQISLCHEIDFNAESFNPTNNFEQVIVFNQIIQEEENGKPTGRFVVTANIVNYNSIEDAEFIIVNKTLANTFRKQIKPYNAIKVWGDMVASDVVEEVKDDDIWGESNKMERQTTPTKREFIITGANGSSLDRETYSEESIAEARVKVKNAEAVKNDFSSNSNNVNNNSSSDIWGNVPESDGFGDSDDDDIPW